MNIPPSFSSELASLPFARVLLGFFLICGMDLNASVRINEIVAANSGGLLDEDEAASDWIELYNDSDGETNLNGWFITDDEEDLTKWSLPDVTIDAKSYLVIFASGKDRRPIDGGNLHTNFSLGSGGEYLALVTPGGRIEQEFAPTFPRLIADSSYGFGVTTSAEEALTPGADCRWHVAAGPIDGWTSPDFNDDGWNAARTGIGFDSTNGAYWDLIGEGGNVSSAMRGINASALIRIPFTLGEASDIVGMSMKLKWEDGFVAWVNGREVARENAPETVTWNSASTSRHADAAAQIYDQFVLDVGAQLRDGENILAIQMLNDSPGGSDALIVPELTALRRSGSESLGYLSVPTPGFVNAAVVSSAASGPVFSKTRGYYDAPFSLAITSEVPGTAIKYTTDGKPPTASVGTLYDGPIEINRTTVVRAATVSGANEVGRPVTHSFLFVADIAVQSVLRTTIRNHPTYGPLIKDSLLALPAVSVVRSSGTVSQSETETSLEFIDPAGAEPGFQIDCGIRLVGGASVGSAKNNWRLFFRSQYGYPKLKYPVFADHPYTTGASDEFDVLQLRGGSHDNFYWLALPSNPPVGNRHGDAQYIRNRWISDMEFLMGHKSLHGRFVQVYLNGTYHGLYHLHERPMHHFQAKYYGGDSDDYHYTNSARTGSSHTGGDWSPTWAQVKGAAQAGFEEAKEWIDVVQLADYMLLNFYCGNSWDWSAQHNWMASGPKDPGRDGWKFYSWDSDIMLQDVANNNLSVGVPDGVFTALMRDDDFQVLFRDRIYKFCFNDGLLTPGQVCESYDYRMNEIYLAIVAETARWQPGSATSLPWDRDGEWQAEWDYMTNTFWPERTGILLDQMKSRGWYPVDAPEFLPGSGTVAPGFSPNIIAESGTVYYTTDGSDPRLPGGEISPTARVFSGGLVPITLLTKGSNWKYLDDGTDQGTAWTEVTFDDTTWSSGEGQFGYGESDQTTTLDFGPNGASKPITYYFRRTFQVSDVPTVTELRVNLLRDDGAVVFINGSEVLRDNMPEGAIGFETPASGSVSGANESNFFSFDVPPSVLVEGENVIAVEVHQSSPSSSDLSFDLEIGGRQLVSTPDIEIAEDTLVRARALLDETEWSAINDAFYTTTGTEPAAAGKVIVSEIHYHPADSSDYEFLEFKNISDHPLDMTGVAISGGINFSVPIGYSLPPGDHLVVVKNETEFRNRYGDPSSPYYRPGLRIAGQWSGALNNGGESITVRDSAGQAVLAMTYDDRGSWPGRADGSGSSLELKESPAVPAPAANIDAFLNDGDNWRPSSEYHGSPGSDGLGPDNRVVINEVLANSVAPQTDFIELYNTTAQPIDVAGWVLSDSSAALAKYRIPGETTIAADGYLTFDESDFNDPGDVAQNPIPFALSSDSGDDVYLLATDAQGNLMRFVDRVEFPASAESESFGRWPNATGKLYPMGATTRGAPNSANGNSVRVGPAVISEIHYNPDGPDENLEFIAITNSGTNVENLANWRLRGEVDFEFAPTTTLVPGQTVVLVGFDPGNAVTVAAFRLAYGIDASMAILGPWNNSGNVPAKLDDSGGVLKLQRPDSLHTDGVGNPFYPMLVEDTVSYDDEGNWPVLADGGGASLQRISSAVYGDIPANWVANPTPLSGVSHGLDFEAWVGTAFPDATPAADKLSTADPDDDGLINFLEFASVLDPLNSDSARPLIATFDGAERRPVLRYRRRNGAALHYALSFSNDLIKWSDATPHTEILGSTLVGDGTASVIEVRFNQPASNTADATYFRLEVTEL